MFAGFVKGGEPVYIDSVISFYNLWKIQIFDLTYSTFRNLNWIELICSQGCSSSYKLISEHQYVERLKIQNLHALLFDKCMYH